jgi:hypothetical protein
MNHAVHAGPFDGVCSQNNGNSINPVSSSSVCSGTNGHTPTATNNPITGSGGVLTKAINLLAFLTGVASIIIIIIGGIKYVTSSGDSGKVSSAKDTILYAVIGLVVSISARAIILYIVNRVK